MPPEQTLLVKTSWAKVTPMGEIAATLFYNRLFELDPSVRCFFKGDMGEQGAKLMEMIAVAVEALDRLETIMPSVQDLRRRHLAYGFND